MSAVKTSKTKTLSVLILFTLLVLAAIPYAVGYHYKTKWQEFFQNVVQDDPGFQVSLVSYQQGWLSSKAIVSLACTGCIPDKKDQRLEYAEFQFDLQHGPLFHHLGEKSLQWSWGRLLVHGKLKAIGDVSSAMGLFGIDDTLLSVEYLATFDGSQVVEFEHPGVNVQVDQDTYFDWQGLHGVFARTTNPEITKINLQLKDMRLVSDGDLLFKMAQMDLDMHLPRDKVSRVWAGHTLWTLPDFSVFDYVGDRKTTRFSLQGFKFEDNVTGSGNQLDEITNINLEKIVFDNVVYGPLYVNTLIENINAKAWGDYQEWSWENPFASGQEALDALKKYAPDVFGGSVFTINDLSLVLPAGKLTAVGKTIMPSEFSTQDRFSEMYHNSESQYTWRVPQSVFKSGLGNWMKAMHLSDAVDVDVFALLSDWVADGRLLIDDGYYVFMVSYDNNELLLNKKPWPDEMTVPKWFFRSVMQAMSGG